MGLLPASNRDFITIRSVHVIPVCWQPLLCMFTNSEGKFSLVGVVRSFWWVLENYDCRTSFNSTLGMEYNDGLYGFSAVKVKLVGSLI